MRLSIEVTPEQHKLLKASAAMDGKTIKDYVLEKALPRSEAEQVRKLEEFLEPRIASAEAGSVSKHSASNIVANAKARVLGRST